MGPLRLWARGHGPNGPYVNPGLPVIIKIIIPVLSLVISGWTMATHLIQ